MPSSRYLPTKFSNSDFIGTKLGFSPYIYKYFSILSSYINEYYPKFCDTHPKSLYLLIEILKNFVERSSFSKEEKEITKTYIDLGGEIFYEVDCIKAEAECVKLCGLLEQYRNKRNK